MTKPMLTAFDRAALSMFPTWGVNRLKARLVAEQLEKRHYDAASYGPRTQNWPRVYTDADATLRAASRELRTHARDLLRNNGHAQRGQRVVAGSVVGSGIIPKPAGANEAANKVAADLWKAWARKPICESDSRLSFDAMLYQMMSAFYSDGDVFLRRRPRRLSDGLPVPLQIQVLEADFLNTGHTQLANDQRGPIIQGIEFDLRGRRTAYWMWKEHPGSGRNVGEETRVPASEIIHLYEPGRPGQTRGVSLLGAAIVDMKDLGEFETAELMRQKVAACFAAFVTDTDGLGAQIGQKDATNDMIDGLSPGMVNYLPIGKQVTFGNPPSVSDSSLADRTLRRVASGIGITYEDFTGDYSKVNYSSARMARISMQANVEHWQNHLIVPLVCAGVWDWMCEAAQSAGLLSEEEPTPGADWICPAMPLLEPDKEALGAQRQVRNGMKTPSQLVREQGRDWDEFVAEYSANVKQLKSAGVVLDSDASATSATGQEQPSETAIKSPEPAPTEPPAKKPGA